MKAIWLLVLLSVTQAIRISLFNETAPAAKGGNYTAKTGPLIDALIKKGNEMDGHVKEQLGLLESFLHKVNFSADIDHTSQADLKWAETEISKILQAMPELALVRGKVKTVNTTVLNKTNNDLEAVIGALSNITDVSTVPPAKTSLATVAFQQPAAYVINLGTREHPVET